MHLMSPHTHPMMYHTWSQRRMKGRVEKDRKEGEAEKREEADREKETKRKGEVEKRGK